MRNKILNCQNFAFHNVTLRFSHHALSKGLLRYGSVRNYGTVRLDFGKKYDTELRTEFLEKVRYGTEMRYYICSVPYRTLFVFQ